MVNCLLCFGASLLAFFPPFSLSIDAVFKIHRFTKNELSFLKKLRLANFLPQVQWGVLHESLIMENIRELGEERLTTTIKGEYFPLFLEKWRQKIQWVFLLETKNKRYRGRTPCSPQNYMQIAPGIQIHGNGALV